MSDSNQKPRKKRGFFSALMSHFFIAIMAVAAFAVYFHQSDIKAYIGANICRHDVLGKYGDNYKVPPIALTKPETGQTAEPEKTATTTDTRADATEKPETLPLAAPVKSAASNDNPPAPPAPDISDKPDLETGWREARNLFWQGSKDTQAAYEKLIEAYPDNADLVGELGNVYYRDGEPLKAADMYFKAGELFIAAKNYDRARDMAAILVKLAPQKAKELQAAMQQ